MRRVRRLSMTVLAGALALPLAGGSPLLGQDATPTAGAPALEEVTAEELEATLERIREATSKYRDVEAALADGYMPDPMNLCVDAAVEGAPRQLGGMGIHYFRPDLLEITGMQPRVAGTGTHQDFERPSVLVYVPDESGELVLGAVENLVFAEGWEAAGHEGPPSFMGLEYWKLVDNPATPVDEAHMFEPHYELHLWVHLDNPKGVAFPFNPAVSCEHHDGPTTVEEGMEYLRENPPPGPPPGS